jgi:SAM-dependent methyltransferase
VTGMTGMSRVPAAAFEARYRADPDPWRFATSAYEQERYRRTLAALPRPRYRRAFEPGCSIGVLTERLALRCGELVALDGAAAAVEEARRRCARLPHVDVRRGEVPADWPEGRFDLVVLSELGYYFTAPALAALRDQAVDALEPGGDLMAVHWRGVSADHLLGGDEVHGVLGASPALRPRSSHLEEAYRLDVWSRT